MRAAGRAVQSQRFQCRASSWGLAKAITVSGPGVRGKNGAQPCGLWHAISWSTENLHRRTFRSTAGTQSSQIARIFGDALAPHVGVLLFFALTASAGAQGSLAKARECLLIGPETKERLDCFDKLYPPRPLRKISVRTIQDCKQVIEKTPACLLRAISGGADTSLRTTE